ncbi:hypothetical protein [Streptomyces sp. NPDC056796]|uniref:hypothetical protein n=1 Tax=Streptomyces sp. NPDC056796 TaxID=3345947 RepID=UPI0036B207C8
METIETIENNGIRARIVVDPDPINPRKDGLNKAYALTIDTHLGQYIEVDEDGGPLAEAWARISWRKDAVEVFERYARIYWDATTFFDHKSDGATVIWYVLGAEVPHLDLLSPPYFYIRFEAEQYRRWAAGEVYGVITERMTWWMPVDPTDERTTMLWEESNAQWGINGYDLARWEAEEAAPYRVDAVA